MKVDVINTLAFCGALTLSMAGGGAGSRPSEPPARVATSEQAPREQMADGTPALRDARGALTPLVPYTRIASAALIADRVLADLCEPDRIVAFTRYAAQSPIGHRYMGKPAISGRDDIERILALGPQLLLGSDLVDASYSARLREHGVQVFDLGPMRGLATLLPSIRAIGRLIGAPERAERYAQTLLQRMRAVAPPSTTRPRPRALYLSLYGDRLFGAGDQTSYHDVLVHAGLRDVAAEQGLVGWLEPSSERVLSLAPELIITRTGMREPLCRHPGLDQLAACRAAGRVIELDGALLEDPGPGMLEAAEALFAVVFPP
jgi:iron complex transport system substrate-binding protein